MEYQINKQDILNLVKTNNLMDLLPILLYHKKENFKITPSEFIKEMELTTEERYKKLISTTFTMKPHSQFNYHPYFLVTPVIIVFQSFEARKTYSVQVQVRNCHKSLMPIKMTCPKSSYFEARFLGTPISKLAPGLTANYEVIFTPQENTDYNHQMLFKTENDLFVVPIIAIGPRALLDIPNKITVQSAPVKIPKTKVVLMRNIGHVPAVFRFTMTRPSSCFKIDPAKGCLMMQEIVQLSVTFESASIGNYAETMYLILDSGEKLSIDLYGSAENISVRLDKNCIVYENTYMGLKRSKSFRIYNNSQNLVKYSWKKYKTLKEDLEIIDRISNNYKAIKELEMIKFVKQDYFKLCNYKKHELAWERILNDELHFLEKAEFNFSSKCFKIEPQSGEIFPKSSAELIAVFEPKNCGSKNAEAYLEISGLEERLVLQMKGNGVGPLIVLSVEVLDIDFIFLCSVHSYEVIAINKGDIPGTISFKSEPLVFGGKVEVTPESKHINPEEHVAFIITFTSNRHGDFTEKLNFIIAESQEIISMIIKGKIVSPTLHFDRTLIDFGNIPVGFPVSKDVTLSNLSMVPVTFSLRILYDGTQPSISIDKYSKFTVKPLLPKSPKEFKIEPTEGVVKPFSSRTVTLTVTANIARRWTTNLIVDMWDSETESVACPIRFISQIASVSIEPSIISISFCFLNFPYSRTITLQNNSRIAAYFYIIPQKSDEPQIVTFSANIWQGIIEPKSAVKISLTILMTILGRQTIPLNVLIFGNEEPNDMCSIICVGQGPVMTLKPNILNWGEVTLLHESTKFLTVTNESPIPASFKASMLKSDSPWTITPDQSVLAPEEKITLNVTLFLRDRGKYQDSLKIYIQNSKTLSCTTNAIGIGNSLIMNPDISGRYDLGILFCRKKYIFDIKIKNEGTKQLTIIWSPMEDLKIFAGMKLIYPPDQVFKIDPPKLDLLGGQSKILSLEVLSLEVGIMKKTFYCHANIDSSSKEIHLISEISAQFVEPIVIFNKTELHFQYNIGPDGIEGNLSDTVKVINTSVLPITVNLLSNHPFYIKDKDDHFITTDEIDLGGLESKELAIFFQAEEHVGRYCKIIKDKLLVTFKDHSKKSSVRLIGEVNYPNVAVLPRTIDFGCVPVGTSTYREFILVNINPIAVHYNFFWDSKSSVITYLDEPLPSGSDLREPLPCDPINSDGNFRIPSMNDDEEGEARVNISQSSEVKEVSEPSEIIVPKKPVLKIPSIDIKQSDLKEILFPLVQKYYISDDNLTNAYKMAFSTAAEKHMQRPDYAQIFDITPFYGRLEKYESQVITMSFHSNLAVKAHIKAHLLIEAGPTEIITVNAKAAHLSYTLSKVEIDFGKQLFSETATQYLKVSNTSYLPFDFETNTVDNIITDGNENFPVEAGVLIVTPRTAHVPPESEKLLRVQYNPGIPGKFENSFQLHIGYLEPINIRIRGYAVFPQVYFSLNRTQLASLPVEIGYAAVASITPDWILENSIYWNARKLFSNSETEKGTENSKEDGKYPMERDETFEKIEESYVVINKHDFVPSTMDIEMAIERILAHQFLSSNTEPNDKCISKKSIPNFSVPAYELDLGIVIIGRSTEQTFTATNYGPLPAMIYQPYEKDSKRQIINIKMKNRLELKIGGTSPIVISLVPRRNKSWEQYEKVEHTFHFEVQNGAKIPVKVSAIVTYPFIIPSTKILDFGGVTCGNCKLMNLKIKNAGWVPAIWNLSFYLNSKDVNAMHQSGFIDGRSVFHWTNTKGTLYPHESSALQITFKPHFEGRFSATMLIKLEEGFVEHKIVLIGEGNEARLKISDTSFSFQSVLPYPKSYFKCFTVQNPCTFPIEFYLPDFDDQIYEEERILRVLNFYYQKNELLLPVRNPGDQLPPAIVRFYELLVENVSMQHAEMERQKIMQNINGDSILSLNFPVEMSTNDLSERKVMKGKKNRPRSSLGIGSAANFSLRKRDMDFVLKDKTKDEIEDLVLDYIRQISIGESRFDPVQEALDLVMPKKKSDDTKQIKGFVVILHAAPQTNSTLLANYCNRILNKVVLTIDHIILEEVALGRCQAAIKLRDIIEESCTVKLEELEDSDATRNRLAEEEEENEMTFEEQMEELNEKIQSLFLTRQISQIGHKKTDARGTSLDNVDNARKERSQTPNVKSIQMSALEVTEDLILEILRFRFHMDSANGVVIAHLNSIWITNRVNALKTLIRAAGNISDILVMCLVNTYDNYKRHIMETEKENERRENLLKEEALRILQEEMEEEFFALDITDEKKLEIRNEFLNIRREEYKSYLKLTESQFRLKERYKYDTKSSSSTLPFTGSRANQNKDKEKSATIISTRDGEKSEDKKENASANKLNGIKSSRKNEDFEALQFIAFEEEMAEMRRFLEYWDRISGTVIKSTSYSSVDYGIPLWLINEANPNINIFPLVCQYLYSVLQNSRASHDMISWTTDVPEAITYSVITSAPRRERKKIRDEYRLIVLERSPSAGTSNDVSMSVLSENTLSEEKVKKSDSQSTVKMKKKRVDSSRGRRAESRSSASARNTRIGKSISATAFEDFNTSIKSRWILQPQETMYWCIQFFPKTTGEFSQSFPISVMPSQNSFTIKCNGICDIPRLDMSPENIFSRVTNSKPKDNIYLPTFFYSNCCFDFGSVIPSQQKEFGRGRELHAVFSLTNISTLPVELTVMFSSDALRDEPIGSPHFDIQPTTAELKPYQTFLLSVYANPTKYGTVEETLLLFVKDNPKIETIKIKCYGVKVNLVFEPKVINFDRLLLYRYDKKKITFTNSNLIPLFISLSGYDNLPSQFKFSTIKNWVQPLTTFVLEIEYNATEIQLIKEEVIRVLVFERPESLDPVQVLSFTVSAEAYDASIDIFFSTKYENHVDFGDIRAENESVKSVILKNTGKYMLGFKININYDLLEENENKEFHIFPKEGNLVVGKPTTLNVHFLARSEINWKRLPLFKIILTEPYNNDEFVASIPIEVSARSFFSRYLIRPLPEMNIGPIQIGSQKTAPLTIENKGQFSLSYSIELLSGDTLNETNEEVSVKPSKNVLPRETDGLLKAGSFDISPSTGTVEVKETSMINVTFSPTEVQQYEETVILRISECPPCAKNGIKLRIVAEGCLPMLDFQDFNSIFREHHIKQSERDLPYLTDTGFQTVFTVDTSELCFKNVCLGKTVKARIHLENKGQIDCHVISSASKAEGRKIEAAMDTETDIFRVEPKDMIIPPYESCAFIIYFQPEILQNYKGLLSLMLVMPQKYSFITWTINLYGIVCIPQIEIVEPSLRSAYGQGILNFPPTATGRTSNALISFRNRGKIDSKVIVELYNAEKGIFTLIPKSKTEIMLKAWEISKPIDLTTVVSIVPGQTAEFDVIFKPLEVKKYTCDIRLFVVDNGFENLCYKLFGEALLEEIVLERIKMDAPFAEESSSSQRSYSQTVSGHYFVNLGCCFINKKKRILARLSNKTEKDYFRFEWDEIPELTTVQPSAGHLYPEMYKDILITFSAKENIELNERPLICSLKKINFTKSPPTPSWDTRLVHHQSIAVYETDLTLAKAINGGSSSQEGCQAHEIHACDKEPFHDAIPDSDSKLLLHLSAVVDYARLQCETKSINFPDTFTFQTREFCINLENVGRVPLHFLLELKSVTHERFKIDKALQTSSLSWGGESELFPSGKPNMFELNPFAKNISPGKKVSDCHKSQQMGSKSFFDLCSTLLKAPSESYNPFRLGKVSGDIGPGECISCPITFSPLDVNEYKGILKINVENAHPEFMLEDIAITARSTMPHCHFDIPDSDYITSGRRDYSRPGPIGYGPGVPLDTEIKPIEVKVLGVRVTKPIHFYVLNPTENEYNFSWVNVTQNQAGSVQSLHCEILGGSIQPHRQQLMEFVFVSHTAGTFEYFWKFCIPEHKLEKTFLFAITVREPVVHFLQSNLIMRSTSVGATVMDTVILVNQDDVCCDFSIIPESLHSNGGLGSLKVQPLSGKINPKSEIKFRISHTGKAIGKILFRLKCKIKKIQNPLAISIETTTYTVEPVVTFEDFSNARHFADPAASNIIRSIYEFQIDHAESLRFFLTSTSKLSFYYEWIYDKRESLKHHCLLTFSHACGHVPSFAAAQCDLKVVFAKKSALVDFPIKLKISRGPTYVFLLNAKAACPAYKFSFSSHDFGYCYIQNTDVSFYEVSLVFSNEGKTELILESSTDELKNFKFFLEKNRIGPGKQLSIPIQFFPKESISYEENILFTVGGGLYEKRISVSGRGIEFKIMLASVEDAKIQIDAVPVGNKRSKELAIVNRGLAPAKILIGVGNQLPVDILCLRYPEKGAMDLNMRRFSTDALTVSPSEPFVIKQNETRTLTVEYAPRERISSFTETIYMQFQDRVEPLCVVTGSSVGPEFSLDKHYLTFGAVVANYSTVLKLRLINSGDIGGRFKWEMDPPDDVFSISPATGYLSAESDVVIQVTFHPRSVEYCIKQKAECKIFISETENYPSLCLNMCGDCVDLPESIKKISFQCEVRRMDTKVLEIANVTGTDWKLIPIFTGEYFSGADVICVPSMSSEKYEITYSPLTMTVSGTHNGSLFFCLPDGTGRLYDLLGVSLPPSANEVMEREVPCKTKYEELLVVKNWLRSHQRFHVTTVCTTNETPEDTFFTCSGSDQFELPASAEKEYKLTFHAYKVGKLRFSVSFTNGETGEYVWYDITFNVVLCGPLEFITLKTAVRQICSHEIRLENPLDKPIQYKIQCANPDILIPKIDVLAPKSTETVNLSFRPLHPGDKSEQLRVTCPELGVFPMELHLIALEPQMEEAVYFETYLGSMDTQSVNVTNFSNGHATLHCRSSSDEFKPAEERLNINSQETAKVAITFEPFALGQFLGNLFIESERAGNFVFPLVGNSLKPLARGPYILKPEAGITITFKNVLKEEKTFHIYVDNSEFSVKPSQEDIPPGGVCKIHVSIRKSKNHEKQKATEDAEENARFPAMGQLIVECFNPYIKWQYYLKCLVEKLAPRNV